MKDSIEWIQTHKICAIARKVAVADIVETARALFEGGVRSLEITFDQASSTCIEDTTRSIALVQESMKGTMLIGAGTVSTISQAEAAAKAGASFALAPDTNVDVIKRVKELGMLSIPGASTPTEILTAYRAGADIVKLFPAGNLGLAYVKAIRGPINHVLLMAVGGINENNFIEFLDNGFCSCGIGSNIVRNDLIVAKKYGELTLLAKTFTDQINK